MKEINSNRIFSALDKLVEEKEANEEVNFGVRSNPIPLHEGDRVFVHFLVIVSGDPCG